MDINESYGMRSDVRDERDLHYWKHRGRRPCDTIGSLNCRSVVSSLRANHRVNEQLISWRWEHLLGW